MTHRRRIAFFATVLVTVVVVEALPVFASVAWRLPFELLTTVPAAAWWIDRSPQLPAALVADAELRKQRSA